LGDQDTNCQEYNNYELQISNIGVAYKDA